MKRILFLFSILFVTVLSVQAQPKISFDREKQDLGYLLWRNPTTVTYAFTNTGDKPLVISNVTASCGCVNVDWTKQPIPAGGKGAVSAVFDAEAIGHFYKEVGVYCNASPMPIYLEFNGEVCYERYQDILKALGYPAEKYTKEETIKTLVDIVKDLAEQVGITQTISDYGAKLEDLEMLSEKAMEDPCKPGNPREVDVEKFIKLYKKAM